MSKPGFSPLRLLALAAILLAISESARADDIQNLNLKGNIGANTPSGSTSTTSSTKSTTSLDSSSANSSDATMNQDMLFVAPKQSTIQKNVNIQDLDQHSVTLKIERSDVIFEKLHGVMITVVNNTDKAVVVNGDTAKLVLADKAIDCTSVVQIQRMIIPPHSLKQGAMDFITKVVPAAVTVSAIPTVEDMKRLSRPVLDRYGADEVRRRIEFSRFGRRIVWSHQKASGILYVETNEALAGAKVDLPVNLLFKPEGRIVISSIAPSNGASVKVDTPAPENTATPSTVPSTSAPASNPR